MPQGEFPDISTEKLTDSRVKNAAASLGERTELWDAVLPGLGIRISGATGAKTWFVRYRFGANQRRLKIGSYPAVGLAEARRLARERLTRVAENVDPAAERGQRTPDTVEHVAAEFVQRYAKQHNRSWKETERILNRYVLPSWSARLVGDISRRDILELLDGMVDRGAPIMAKQTHATVRKLFNWAVDRGILESSPCVRVPAPAHADNRDRVLSDAELRAVWLACDPLKWPFGPLVRLLILTGQRRDEVAAARWSEFADSLWTIPRERNKSDRAHEVPLSPPALAIIEALPKVDPVLVFTTNGKVPIAGFSNAKRRLDEISHVRDWHLHDLRRTTASGMARLGVAPHVVEKVLNHRGGAISGVAAIYNRHGYADEKRAALCQWAEHVERVIRPGHQ